MQLKKIIETDKIEGGKV